MKVKITQKEYLEYIDRFYKSFEEKKDYITELDSVTGDGDHWVNMNKAFQKIVESRPQLEALKLSDMFRRIGMLIMSAAGGSSGVLYGSAYIKASQIIGDSEFIDINLLKDVLDGKLHAIMERGGAQPGHKTMVDSLYLAVKHLKEALENGKGEEESLIALKDGAIIGMYSTKDMEAIKGRACYQANKGLGHLDPGAVTMALQIETLVDYLLENCFNV